MSEMKVSAWRCHHCDVVTLVYSANPIAEDTCPACRIVGVVEKVGWVTLEQTG